MNTPANVTRDENAELSRIIHTARHLMALNAAGRRDTATDMRLVLAWQLHDYVDNDSQGHVDACESDACESDADFSGDAYCRVKLERWAEGDVL